MLFLPRPLSERTPYTLSWYICICFFYFDWAIFPKCPSCMILFFLLCSHISRPKLSKVRHFAFTTHSSCDYHHSVTPTELHDLLWGVFFIGHWQNIKIISLEIMQSASLYIDIVIEKKSENEYLGGVFLLCRENVWQSAHFLVFILSLWPWTAIYYFF